MPEGSLVVVLIVFGDKLKGTAQNMVSFIPPLGQRTLYVQIRLCDLSSTRTDRENGCNGQARVPGVLVGEQHFSLHTTASGASYSCSSCSAGSLSGYELYLLIP